jgi:Glycosyltransferase family 87
VNAHDKATIAVASGLVVTVTSMYLFVTNDPVQLRSAFSAFYTSGLRWMQGGPMYAAVDAGNPNLVSPLFTAVVFGPLSLLPPQIVPAIWTAMGALALTASCRIIARELRLDSTSLWFYVGLLSMTGAAAFTWRQGQITWLLLYPFTRAWLSLRHGQPLRAGLWLAVVIVAKPIVVVIAVLLPWRLWVSAAIGSAVLTVAGILLTGWESLAGWLRALNYVRWISYPANASLWGLLVRLQTGAELSGSMETLRHLPWGLVGAALVLGGLCAVFALRARTIDQRMTLAFLTMLLLSPLGWVYYVPLALAPMVASWPQNRLAMMALACAWVPIWFIFPLQRPSAVVVRTIGSAYSIGLLFAVGAWAHSSQVAEEFQSELP